MDNVVQFRGKTLFPPRFRGRLESTIKAENPKEMVDALEQAICSTLISMAVVFATRLATQAGEKLGKVINGK